jgi:hypothetical protein
LPRLAVHSIDAGRACPTRATADRNVLEYDTICGLLDSHGHRFGCGRALPQVHVAENERLGSAEEAQI